MFAKIVVALESVALVVLLVLFLTGRITWEDNRHNAAFEKIKESSEVLKPDILTVDGEGILVMPYFSINGQNWNINYRMYVYDKENQKLITILQ